VATESIFRRIYSAHNLEDQVAATLRKWYPTYIKEMERQEDMEQGRIPPPRYYTRRNQFQSFPDEQLPLCIVISSGILEPPRRDGESNYQAWWGLGVGVVAAASDPESTNTLVKIYGAATRALLMQQQDLGGTDSQGVEWLDERYDDSLPGTDQQRSVGAVRSVFQVLIDDVVTQWAGPTSPDPDEWPPGSIWGLVEDVIVYDDDGNIIVEVTP
jgi:hypothetical protein